MIPWITSGATLLAVWLNGRDVRLSWQISLLNQIIWLVFIFTYGAWGLLPLTRRCPESSPAISGGLAARPEVGWLFDSRFGVRTVQ